jgi:hypothetical protein
MLALVFTDVSIRGRHALPRFLEPLGVIKSKEADCGARSCCAQRRCSPDSDKKRHGAVPLLRGCATTFQCRKVSLDGGKHVIFVVTVWSFDGSDRRPLVLHGEKCG